jgi:hypothetical protein
MTSIVPALVFSLFAFVSPVAQGALAVRFQLVTPVTGPLGDDEVKSVFQHHLDELRQCAANDDFVKRTHRQLNGSVQYDITISHGKVDDVRVHGSSWLTNPNDFPKCAKEQVVLKLTFPAKDTPSHALVNVIVN